LSIRIVPASKSNATSIASHGHRPRIEGLFARIERWTRANDPADTFWRSISRDNVSTFYGKTAASRIADPSDPTRIFTWLLCESFDDKGNAALYEYVAEDGRNVDTALASEFNRTEAVRSANRYLKRAKYANRTSRLVQPDLAQAKWLFELVMDYGDHEGQSPTIDPTKSWPVRPDPFSTYRAGFDVRTSRRCQRILMFHRFEELGPEPKLVRSLALDYDDFAYPQGFDTRPSSSIQAARASVHSFVGPRSPVMPTTAPASRCRRSSSLLPSSDQEEAHTLDEESMANLPAGADGVRYQWLDLNSEGLSGLLTEQAGAWWVPNLGEGRLGPQQLVAHKPSIGLDTRASNSSTSPATARSTSCSSTGQPPGFSSATIRTTGPRSRRSRASPLSNGMTPTCGSSISRATATPTC
jgi:hypothetical protein